MEILVNKATLESSFNFTKAQFVYKNILYWFTAEVDQRGKIVKVANVHGNSKYGSYCNIRNNKIVMSKAPTAGELRTVRSLARTIYGLYF